LNLKLPLGVVAIIAVTYGAYLATFSGLAQSSLTVIQACDGSTLARPFDEKAVDDLVNQCKDVRAANSEVEIVAAILSR